MEEILLNKTAIPTQQASKIYFFLKRGFKVIGFEALIWISGLTYLVFFSPLDQTHFTICPLANAGIDFCPGCGLGHSITLFFHGKFIQSFNVHPLGFFALIIIIHRIYSLVKLNIINSKKAKA